MNASRRSVALVTGAAGAIGRAIVDRLADDGWTVAACDLASASSAYLDGRGDARRFDLDVRSEDACRAVVDDVVAWAGGIDVVVNNAGVRSAGLFGHVPIEANRAMFDVNYFGACNVTRAALPHMRSQGGGHVVVVSSVGALAGLPALSGYCASKAAVEGWAESVAMELQAAGVRVTLVEPASVRSSIWRSGSFHVDEGAPDAALGAQLRDLDGKAEAQAGDPASVATAIARVLRVRGPVVPTRVPVGATALARHAARGVIPPVAQRALFRRLLHLPPPAPAPPLAPGSSVLVTGVSSGLGLDLAARLHDRGYRVIGSVRNASRASDTRARLGGRDIPLVHMDQTQPESVAAALREVGERCDGNLGALVANSGVKVTGPFEALTDADLRTMIEVNVYGTWAVIEQALGLLRAGGGGRIVVVGSSSGFTGMPGWSGYAAAKFALELWAESVAYELEPHGVRVTMAEPGTFRSEIYRDGSVAPRPDGPSRRIAEVVDERERRSLESAGDASPVVDRIVRALESSRPPARVPVGRGAQIRHLMRGVVPGSVVQRAFAVRG